MVLIVSSMGASDVAPQIVYGTYLGGRDKECATAIAVDDAGNAYVVGRTPSPDFPVTPGAFSTASHVNNDDWTGFVSKINGHGDRLLYSSFLGANFRSSVNAVTVDSQGRAFVVGSTCSSNFPTTRSALFPKAPGSDRPDTCDGFVAWFNSEASQLEYATYVGGSREDTASAVALASVENVLYVGGHTASPDFPISETAAQAKLNGPSDGFLSAIDVRSGHLLYSTYLGGTGDEWVTGIAAAPDGTIYVPGVTGSRSWPGMPLTNFGKQGARDGFVIRFDPTGQKRARGIRIGGSGDDSVAGVAIDSRGDLYIVGSTNSTDFPLAGANPGQLGSAFAVKISGGRFAGKQAGVIWSRLLGGHGEDALLSVTAGMPGSIFVSGRSGSQDFPVTKAAIFRGLEARNDSILMRLRASDGRIQFATFVGGTRRPGASWYNDEATGVVANADGDVYVTGCTLDDRLPVSHGALQPRPKGNSEPFVLRLRFTALPTPVASRP